MGFFGALGEMLVLLFAIAVGYAADKLGYMGGEFNRKLTGLLLNLVMPCMIVAAVLTNEDLPGPGDILSILLVSLLYYALAAVCALVFPKLLRAPPEQAGVYRFALVFTNVGFIGYPVTVALFGGGALFYAVVLTIPFNVLSYVVGPMLLSGRSAGLGWRQVCSPCAVASVLSLALALTRVRFPARVTEALDFVGGLGVPLALLLLGSILAALPLRQMLGTPRLWLLSALRLLVLPALLFVLLKALGVSGTLLGVAVVQMAMPVATNGSLLCLQYGGDADSMAQATFLTTVASIVTIPLIVAVLL